MALVVAVVTSVALTSGHHREAGREDHGSSDQDRDKGAGTGENEDEDDGGPAAPAEYLTQKYTSGHDVSPAQVRHAIAQANALPTGGGTWSLVGPSNVGARVVDLVVDPTHADTLFVAASGGGVWKSTDAGATFASV